MPQFAANISWLYRELPLLERPAAAAADGFGALECLFPHDEDLDALRAAADAAGLPFVLFNAPPGDWGAGERGLAGLPGREPAFREAFDRALEVGQRLGCASIHVMAGVKPAGASHEQCRQVLCDNLRYASWAAEAHGVTLLLEPINQRDMPDYLLSRPAEVIEVLETLRAPNLRLQLDLYHAQIMNGDLTELVSRQLSRIGHIQIAGVPHRHEPDRGEVRFEYLLQQLDALGYDGWVGCEYRPFASTREGLGWLRPMLSAPLPATSGEA